MIKKLFGLFFKRWVISLLGLAALALFIWWAGPLFSFAKKAPLESARSRWIVIIGLFGIYFIYHLWKYLRAKLANMNLLQSLRTQPIAAVDPTAKQSDEEVAALKARFEEAVGVLKQAKLGGRWTGQYLYQLPWYVIVGAPGSGKTTALLNSGLKFPLSEKIGKGAVKGIGGTRNCDWWFTEDAVLLDTAGRYTTHDSYHEVDKAAWLGFLDLLKKYRRRRPINGVFVAISVADLLHQSDNERSEHAVAVRQRLQELHERLGIRFPIYVMVTKSDLLAGFQEFFADFGREERAQVWGMTFPLEDQNSAVAALGSFNTEFSLLEQKLQSHLTDHLQRERDPQRRTLIYAFPQQFGLMKDVLDGFLKEVFDPSRYNERCLLRGVYFTSGTQEGAPLDRVIGALASTFGLGRQSLIPVAGTGKSYFIGKLFKDVIFKEAGLAGANLRLEKQRAWLQRGAFAGAILVSALAGLAWFTSFSKNKSYIDVVAIHVADIYKLKTAVPSSGGTVLDVLPLLNVVSEIPGGYSRRVQGHGFLAGLGLNQAGKLGSAAETVYQRLLRDAFFPRVQRQLEGQLQRGNANNPDILIDALATYLMLGNDDKYDPKAVQQWVERDWKSSFPADLGEEQHQRLSGHLQALLEGPERLAVQKDEALIRHTQDLLRNVDWHQRVYARIKEDAQSLTLPEFTISAAAGAEATSVLTRRGNLPFNSGIAALYTYDGYHQYFIDAVDKTVDALAEEGWIFAEKDQLKDDARKAAIKKQVKDAYYADYIKLWDELLNGIGLRHFNDFGAGAKIVKTVSGSDSPLKRLLVAIGDQTNLDRPTGDLEGNVEAGRRQAANLASKVAERFRRAIKSNDPAEIRASKPAPKERTPVDIYFARLHNFVKSPDGNGPSRLDKVLGVVGELAIYLDDADKTKRSQGVMPESKPIDNARREVVGLPQPLGAMLQQLVANSSNLGAVATDRQINDIWQSEVLPFYNQAVRGRYPIVRSAKDEITLQDFGTFFGPGGKMDAFFEKNIKPYVDTTSRPWRTRPGPNTSMSISANALDQLQRADEIRKTFFPANGPTPSLSFDLVPISLDAEKKLNRIMVDIEGQQLVWEYGPAKSKAFVWPAPNGNGRVRVEVAPALPSGRSGLTYTGQWAVFRMLDEVTIDEVQEPGQNQRPTKFHLRFNFEGRTAEFDLRTASAFNAIQSDARRALERFTCPAAL